MIGWDDIYKVVEAVVPLYVALILGYGSVRWWHVFKSDHCDAINRLNCYFILPLLSLQYTSHINPYEMNFRFIGADIISKFIIIIIVALWANCTSHGNYPWSITTFSLSTLSNTLVVGVPFMRAMYGVAGVNLVVQLSINQSMLWYMILLFMYELQRARRETNESNTSVEDLRKDTKVDSTSKIEKEEIVSTRASVSNTNVGDLRKDLEGNIITETVEIVTMRPPFSSLMKIVLLKLAKNPNTYACIVGIIWSLISNRWNLRMPNIVDGSILIMSQAAAGVNMFCMGLFMASQKKIIACGARLALYGMFLRFIFGPITVAMACFAVGLHGSILRIAILQAALPQAVSTFAWAKEYGLHANVLSTAVIFGTLVSLPVFIALYRLVDMIF